MADFKRNVVAEVETRATGDPSAISRLAQEVDRFGDEVKKTAPQVNTLEKETNQLEKENKELRTALRKADNELKRFVKTGKNVPQLTKSFGALKTVIAGLGVATVSQVLKDSVGLIAQFSEQMAKVRAVSGATDEQIAQLTARARELGATTKFTGFEAAEGMEELARNGFRAEEVMVAAGAALNLAASSAVELSSAAEIGSGSLRAFNLDADQFQRVVDVIAKTSASSAVNVASFGESTKEGGAIAVQAGVSLEEFAAAMGIAGNSMIRGTRFGTAFKNAIAKLENVTPKAERALNRYGLTAEDVSVKQHGFTTVMERLSNANLSTSDSFDILGKIAAPTIGVLTNNVDGIKKLHNELNNATGTTDKMAKIMSDNLSGSFKAFISATQEVVLKVGDGLTPNLRDATEEMTNVARSAEGIEIVGKSLGTLITVVQILAKGIKAGFQTIAFGVEEVLSFVGKGVIGLLEVSSKAAEAIGKENISNNLKETAGNLRDIITDFQTSVRRETERELRKTRSSIGDDLRLLSDIWTDTGKKVKGSGEDFKEAGKDVRDFGAAASDAALEAAEGGGALSDEVEKIIQEILGITKSAADIIAKQAPALREAILEIGFDKINFGLTKEQKARLKEDLEEVITAARATGEKIDPVIARAAASLGILFGAYETTEQGIIGFTRATRESIEASNEAAGAAETQSESVKKVAESHVVVRETVDAAGNKIREIVQETKRATDSHRHLAGAASSAAGALRDGAQAASEGSTSSSEAGTSSSSLAESLDKVSASASKASGDMAAVGKSADEAASGLSDAAETAGSASGDLESAAASVEASGDALGEQAQAAGDVSAGLEQMASSSASATEAQDQMRTALEATGSTVSGVQEQVSTLQTAIEGLSSLQVSIDFSAVEAALRNVITLADKARESIESVAVAAEAS